MPELGWVAALYTEFEDILLGVDPNPQQVEDDEEGQYTQEHSQTLTHLILALDILSSQRKEIVW